MKYMTLIKKNIILDNSEIFELFDKNKIEIFSQKIKIKYQI